MGKPKGYFGSKTWAGNEIGYQECLWTIPIAALVGIPMYIRTETMIPIASILIGKGVGAGTMIALIIGGAGASIPEVSLLASIFKKKMVIAFLVCIMLVATTTGYLFNIFL